MGAAPTYTRRRADTEMGIAGEVSRRYPSLIAALERGAIDVAKVRTILRGVGHVDVDVARKAIARILADAPGLTTGQIATRLRKVVIEADPEEAKKAYERGRAEARVWSCLEPDGTGTMISTGMDAYDLSRANRNINGIARRRKNDGDSRLIDIIRAEVFAELLRGDLSPEGSKGQQHDSKWTFEVKDPKTGEVYVGTTSRRPTAALKRRILARYKTCIHPGCRWPATQCDIDHSEDWAEGGLTTLCNLAPLCRFHHRLKHLTGWRYRKLPGGSIEWISLFGLEYVTHPP